MFKRILLVLTLLTSTAHAGLPPTTSKASGDAAAVTTFNYEFPNFAVTHTGITATFGTLAIAGGGTGLTSTSQNFVFAGPTSGSGAPTWRLLAAGDIPSLSGSYCALAGCTMTGGYINSFAGVDSTGAIAVTGAPYSAGTATTSKPQVLIEPTGATSTGWATAGTLLGVNAASGFTGNYLDLQNNGASRLKFDGTTLTVAASASVSGTFSGASLTGTSLNSASNNTAFPIDGSRTFNAAGSGITMFGAASGVTNSSGQFNALEIKPVYASTGTAAGTDILINRTGTTGSGAQLLIDGQVGGVSKFKVDTAGAVTLPAMAAAGVVTNSAAGLLSSVAPGTSGNVLASNGSAWVASSTSIVGISTDWVAYTPTINGNGTSTAVTAWHRRIGDTLYVRGNYTNGTPTGTTGSITLPAGLAIDSAKLSNATSTQAVGYGHSMTTTAAGIFVSGTGFVYFYDGSDTANVYIGFQISGKAFHKLAGSALWAAADIESFNFSVPISGWGTSTLTTNKVAARYHASATSITGSLATISWTTSDYDTDSAMSAGTYTVPAGLGGTFDVKATLEIAGTFALNNTVIIEIQKNGTAVKNKTYYAGGAVTAQTIDISDEIAAAAGDTIRVQVSSSATSPSITSSNTKNVFSIMRTGG